MIQVHGGGPVVPPQGEENIPSEPFKPTSALSAHLLDQTEPVPLKQLQNLHTHGGDVLNNLVYTLSQFLP